MKRRWIGLTLGIWLAAGAAAADTAMERLETALPHGWTVLATESELVIRHDRPCYLADAPGAGTAMTIQLHYRLEPAWSPQQIAAAKASNARLDAELRAASTKVERARLAARRVKLPHCTLGDHSLFDGDDTYAQLGLKIDPPEVIAQARQIVALVNRQCGA